MARPADPTDLADGQLAPRPAEAGAGLDAHRTTLWRLAYQLTGDPAQAEDVVQETFVRALERWPPADDAHLRSWLVRVATNLGIDVLRRRKRATYIGPWLPVPVESSHFDDDSGDFLRASTDAEPETRYALKESVSYAFLTALEALTPRQRSALLLRDVLGYSAREVADVLSTTEANVRIAHLRARRALADYEARPRLASSELDEATMRALGEFISCLRQGDAAGLEKLIAEAARVVTDAGGEFNAARTPLVGRERAIHFHLRIAKRRGAYAVPQPCSVNGMPAVLVHFTDSEPRRAPWGVLRCELDADGRMREIQWILATPKVARLVAVRT